MFRKRYYYLIKLQYLGYRFHGWQKQPKLKTVHLMIDKTLKFIFNGKPFKTLGAGRTDAMVSAEEAAMELFTDHQLEDLEGFLETFNLNLPQDIRAISIEEIDESFNIINDSTEKEYHYLFAFGDKFHPFCAPIMTTILADLDVSQMMKAAKIFEGEHNFKAYCYRPSETGNFLRTIDKCELKENEIYTANFFPETTYLLKVSARGFGRNQIRLMMGALIEVGKGEFSLEYLKQTLTEDFDVQLSYIAPASGLILNKVEFNQ